MTSSTALLRPVVRLLDEVGHERGLFLRSTLSMTAFQAATAAAAGLSTAVATSVIADTPHSLVVALLMGLVAAVIAAAVFTWIESWLSHVLAYRVIAALRMRVYDAVERIVPARTGTRRTGEVAGTAMNDVETLEWFYAHTLGSGVNAIVSPALVSVALVAITGPIGLIVPAGVALLLAVPWILARVQVAQGTRIRARLGDLQAVSFEGAEARRELTALDLTDYHREQVLARTADVQRAKRGFAMRAAGESALADVIVATTSLSFLVALMAGAAAGTVDPVVIPVALVLVSAAVVPAAGAFVMVQRLGEMSAAASRVLSLLDEVDDEPAPRALLPAPRHGAVRFDAVTFSYAGGPPVLRGLDLEIAAGETVALVGGSGAGKTTVARLLTGLWSPDTGAVTLDGVGLHDIEGTSLRREIALVSQNPFVFRGTVRSNLLLADPDATETALWRALTDAGLAGTVRAWEDGLDTRVGDRGATMSGGQRQRLSIAQVLLRDPAVLILDEASAQLDTVREADLADAVARLRDGRTTIVIAHRVSTIRRAPRVVLLEDGRVVADGAHADLLATHDAYRTLIAHDQAPPAGLAGTATPPGRR
ncbi:ABC transporter ATP-binding protein [Microbacterium xanthum]|uniref:ABC transporter ATP-binding protein n=1 Tax=Microbacterium xanthum TaxID=3079794 RepID=UPI002AD34859|nr:ABC transporter ATP-binding protein [Microbacterium sp. KSW-48]MDZ8172213.1 ABC transporter ATP-binding protein [Microbacterium sp. KSW-48]